MTVRRLEELGKLMLVGAIVTLALGAILEPLFNYLWPRIPGGNERVNSTMQVYRGDRSTTVCRPAEPSDAMIEKARLMGLGGASSEEIRKYLDHELETAAPNCLELGLPSH